MGMEGVNIYSLLKQLSSSAELTIASITYMYSLLKQLSSSAEYINYVTTIVIF